MGNSYELLFNLTGQKVVIWNAGTGAVVEEDTHLGVRPLAAYLNGSLSFEHQDWLGTERLLTCQPPMIMSFIMGVGEVNTS